MLTKKFHIAFAVIVLIALFLISGYVRAENIQAVPQRDGIVSITKHDFIALQHYIQALQEQSDHTQKKAEYWENRYAVTEECVRENLKQSKPVMTCFNDLEI